MRWSNPPPRASAIALSLSTSWSIGVASAPLCRKISPLRLTETVNGSWSWLMLLALVCGRSTGTPTVSSGAETMKMISSTSMTSTIGVTLMSLMTPWRRWRRLPTAFPTVPLMPMRSGPRAHSALVDLPRQDGGKLVGEPLHPVCLLVHLGREFIIKNGRRYGRHEADRGGEQGLGDARGDHRQRGILRLGDRLEARHDAPDGAEQADERARRADRRQDEEPALQPLDLARDGHVHHLLDPHLKARERARLPLEAALPFAHGCDKERAHRRVRARGERAVEVLERLARPEGLLELVHVTPGPAIEDGLVDHDGPHPNRCQ